MVLRPTGNDPRLKLDPDDLEAASVRAMPEVANRSGMGDNMVMLAGFLGCLALGGLVWVNISPGDRHRDNHRQPSAQMARPPVQPSTLPPIQPELQPNFEPQPQQSLLVQPPVLVQPQKPATPDNNGQRAPALVIDNSQPAGAQNQASAAGAQPAKTMNANDQFIASQNSDVSQKASKIGDPSRIVPQGAVIPAVLETAINSDLPGYTRAIVSRDIRSFDGTTVLIPRGSRLIGQYKSGLTSGETRAFIIWNRLIRPDGVSVQLASPATDDLGQAGMSGSVDTHFAKRFGAAMLLSVVNGLANVQGKSTSTIVIGTSSNAQSVMSDVLSNDSKIPPTIKVPQGASIEVFAARDLDFNLGQ